MITSRLKYQSRGPWVQRQRLGASASAVNLNLRRKPRWSALSPCPHRSQQTPRTLSFISALFPLADRPTTGQRRSCRQPSHVYPPNFIFSPRRELLVLSLWLCRDKLTVSKVTTFLFFTLTYCIFQLKPLPWAVSLPITRCLPPHLAYR